MNYRYPVTFYAVVLSILVFLHLSACSSLKKQQNEVPLWVSQGVSDPVYYIGVGHSEKSKSVTNYQEKANRAALQAIAEQIQVNLKSSSVLVNLEIDQKLIEDFSQIVQVSANHNLQGYERFALYETPTDYYVGYRLSRADHRNQITRQRKQALEKSQTFYQIALKKEQEQDYIAALLNYAQTLDASKNYISEVIYNQEDTTYYFLRDTYKRASQIMQAIQLTETPSLISLRYGAQTSHKLGTITIFDIPQKQVPLTIEFTAPARYQRPILTNTVGELIFDLQKLCSNKTTEQLIAKVNLL